MYYLLLPTPAARVAVIDHLKRRGILAVFHYQPLHLSPMGRSLGGREGDCPVTEDAADRLLRLPFYNSLTPAEQGDVIDAIRSAPC
jgi:dTDP-4-amino-4,6-dideoxygalactose transaminase